MDYNSVNWNHTKLISPKQRVKDLPHYNCIIILIWHNKYLFKLCNSYQRAHSFARIMQTKHCKLWTVTALSRYNCGGSSREWAVNSRDTRVWCATKGDKPQIIYNYCRCCFMLACLYTQVRLPEFTLFSIQSSSVLC